MLYDPRRDVEVKIDPWRKVLFDAADLLDERGWCQYKIDSNGRFCALGAILEVLRTPEMGWQVLFCEVEEKMVAALGKTIPIWNDGSLMTKRHVTATLRRVASE